MSKTRILLIEDNPADVLLLKKALRQATLDFQLFLLEDGEQATRFLERHPHPEADFDLVLLDLNLPRVDGEAVLRKLRHNERFADVPVILWSSVATPPNRSMLQELRVARFINKPISLDEFLKIGAEVRDVVVKKSPPLAA